MKVLNGIIRAVDIKGRRAVVWHDYDGQSYHANIIAGQVNAFVRISYKTGKGEPSNFGMVTTTVSKNETDALKRIELA